MEKINVAELLKDCPKGMELDCAMFEDVFFDEITNNKIFPICIKRIDGYPVTLTKHGGYANCPSSKCVIFPKGKTTWEGFVPPCKFNDGDIIFTHANCLKVGVGNTWISIFKEKRNGGVATYVDYAEDRSDYYSDLDGDKALLCMESDILRQRFATEEEKEKLFNAIKDRGYRWDDKTKILEKLTKSYKEETKNNAIFDYNAQCCDIKNHIIKEETKTFKEVIKPIFRVGNKIRLKSKHNCIYTVFCLTCDDNGKLAYKLLPDNDEHLILVSLNKQDNYELVPNKFDINTLKPFDKVLVRLTNNCVWMPKFFSYYDTGPNVKYYPFVTIDNISYPQCIPYNGNEHLCRKTYNCDDFYKNWK